MPVWLITGASNGLGAQVAARALADGDTVVATSRDASRLADLAAQGAHVLSLDMDSPEHLQSAVNRAVALCGTIDIFLNSAGDAEVKGYFQTYVFAPLALVRAVLPVMRRQGSGTIALVGSMMGWEGAVANSLYCGVKFATAGIAESLREEVKGFGIHVVAVEPGMFRTGFLGAAHRQGPARSLPDYDGVLQPLQAGLAAYDGRQPGDPRKAAGVIVEALAGRGRAAGRELPRRLLLGPDAVEFVTAVMAKEAAAIDAWRDVSGSTNFDA